MDGKSEQRENTENNKEVEIERKHQGTVKNLRKTSFTGRPRRANGVDDPAFLPSSHGGYHQ